MKKKQFGGVRHGEVALIPYKGKATGKVLSHNKNYVLAHSETGHHHVLEGSAFDVLETKDKLIIVNLFDDTALVHHKTFDKHRTIGLPPSVLKRYEMVEVNPASEAIQVVRD